VEKLALEKKRISVGSMLIWIKQHYTANIRP